MSLLAFDPERVGWIREAMTRAIGDLEGIRLSDPLAVNEAQRIGRARAALADRWRPLTSRLLSCPALDATPPRPPLTIDTLGVVAMTAAGWTAATDPLDGTAVPAIPTPAELALLAGLLCGDGVVDLLGTAGDVEALVARLVAIAHTPGAAALLLTSPAWNDVRAFDTLAVRRWTLAERLARAPSDASADDLRDQLDALDRAIAVLASIASSGSRVEGAGGWLGSMAATLEPYAAALVVRALAPTGERLGELSATILARWVHADPTAGQWRDRRRPDDGRGTAATTGDLLLPLVAADAAASLAYAHAAVDEPRLLFDTIDDAEVVSTILSVATDPSTTKPPAAGALLRPLLEWVCLEDPWRYGPPIGSFDPHALLAEVVAPWLLQFHADAKAWSWTTVEGDAMLALLVDDAAALEVLLATTGRWLDLDAGVALGSDGSLDVHRLDAMAGTFDQLCRLAAAEEFDDGRFLRLVTDSVIGWGSSLASALASAIPAIGATAAKVAPLAVDALSDWLVARGVLPPDADTAATLAHGRYEGRVSWAATVAISATVASLVDAGALPATSMEELASALDDDAEGDGCAVRDLHDRLLDYVTSMRGRCDPAVANALDTILESFLSAPYINGVCA